MNPLPIFYVRNGIGNIITVPNQQVILATTYLSRDAPIATTILQVENSTDFDTTNGATVIGTIGSQNAERKTASSKTNTSITVGALSFSHSRGETVTQVSYTHVEITTAVSQYATFGTAVSVEIQYDSTNTVYNSYNALATTWYRIRFFNTITNQYSAYSNPAYAGGYGTTTAGYIIEQVRKLVGNTTLPDDFFITALNEARKVANTQFGFGRAQEWRAEFESPIQMLAGKNYVDLPSNIDFNETNRSVLNARYNLQSYAGNYKLTYVDKRRWNALSYQTRVAYTSTNLLGDGTVTSIPLTTSGDFLSAGTAYIATDKPTQSILRPSYTGNNLSTKTLTGIPTGTTGIYRTMGVITVTIAVPGVVTSTGHGLVAGDIISFTTTGALPTGLAASTLYYVLSTGLTADTFQLSTIQEGTAITTTGSQSGVHTMWKGIPAGTQVYAWTNFTLPVFYTVFPATINGIATYRLYFDRPITNQLQGKNLLIDYYKQMTDIQYLNDVIPENWRSVYFDYMKFAIKRRRDDSIGEDDEDFKRFMHGLQTVLGNPHTGQSQIIIS